MRAISRLQIAGLLVAAAGCGASRSSSTYSSSGVSAASTGSCPQEAVIAMALGSMSTTALLETGQACAWGYSGSTSSYTPTLVAGVTDLVELGAGEQFDCGRTKAGAVWCWGRNRNGQLGDGGTTERTTPAEVKGVTGAVSLAVADAHVCVAQADGAVKCWGRNHDGQVGNGSTGEVVSTPVTVAGLTDIVTVATTDETSCAAARDGRVWCWGNGRKGQLGLDRVDRTSPTPVEIAGVTAARLVLGSSGGVCAVAGDGTARCWGSNSFGMFGVGNARVIGPTLIPELAAATSLSIAGAAIRFVNESGQLIVRGDNGSGQLGFRSQLETVLGSEVPAPVRTWMPAPGLDQIRTMWGGAYHTCVQKVTGEVLCFGSNDHGRLGTGGDEPRDNVPPTRVTGLAAKLPATTTAAP